MVEVERLSKSFGENAAVKGVSFTVAPGQIFGLLAPNGAGKTTIVRMLVTILPPDAGRAAICGFELRREPAQAREHIGYVPQALSADGTLTGYENLVRTSPPGQLYFRVGAHHEHQPNPFLLQHHVGGAVGHSLKGKL
ncbi:MAG: ATP-binding cassette domain-containing protein [Desulfotomaculales bacterium]